MRRSLPWAVLGLLLAGLLLAAVTLDRRTWPGLMGDEATYLMQAESLAWDFDLTYERGDYQRFVAHWGIKPDGVILQSSDRGATFTYGKPAFYPTFLAPFSRLSPTRGPAVANVLLLALAALLTAHTLSSRLGATAPLWVAAFVFASVTFANAFWAHADLFLACLTALALALAYREREAPEALPEIWGERPEVQGRAFLLRWAAVGALLAPVALSRPFYLGLLLPAALAVPRERRRQGLAALGAGALLVAGLSVAASYDRSGSWTSYGGERLAFYSYTGFPKVDLADQEWSRLVARRGPGNWTEGERLLPYAFEPRLTGYNLLYFSVGRNTGLLPYYLPLLLGLVAFRKDRGRWALLLAVALAVAGFLFVRPFNFYGGGAALANRYFLPVYPALWFLCGRSRPWAWPLAITLAAVPFLAPSWLAPAAYPLDEKGGWRYVSASARAWLPYETTQDHLKPSGQEDVVHNELWVKPLGTEVRVEVAGQRFRLEGRPVAEVLIASPRPLPALRLEFDATGPTRVDLAGAELRRRLFEPSGGSTFDFALGRPTAVHKPWWAEESWYFYRLEIRPETSPEKAGTSKQTWVFQMKRL
ncbi:MAG TPA: hypothetical protein VF017_14425 [Thermoanaerobaculia bacterium]|nr:hypothetical protein [Thermoanaerobaculia bacterium]